MTWSLSVLDFDSSLARAVSLAPAAEALGYLRYWFAEHPPQVNCEMLVGITAQLTSRMRIGTGGVVIRLRNVFQSASNFLFLAAAYPDRIDAGVCGGYAAKEVAASLVDAAQPDDFSQRCRDWVQLIRGKGGPDRLAELRRSTGLPEMWLLGTGPRSALLAAELGVSFAYSLFHTQSQDDPSLMDQYRSAFRPHYDGAVARTMLAISGICGSTDEEARSRLAAAPQWAFVNSNIAGGVQSCRLRLQELHQRYRAEELLILEQSPRPTDAAASLALFAEAAGA